MARRFRFYEKKRGGRRTGSGKIGSMGEGVFYLSLLLVGFASLVVIFVMLVYPVWQANWRYQSHPCEVLDKRIEFDEEQLAVYRAVQIEYQIRGKTYRPWVFDAHGVYADSEAEAQADLEDFQVGEQITCWYDPRNPGTAVVVQGSSALGWVLLVVPIAFVVFGSSGLFLHIVRWGKSDERRAMIGRRLSELDLFDSDGQRQPDYPGIPPVSDVTNSPGTKLAFRLPSSASVGWRLAGYLAACGLWASGALILFWYTARGHLEGHPNWILTLFAALFAAVGIWLVYSFFRQMMITTGVGRTWVEVSAHPLRPGRQYEVFVSQGGRLKFQSLRVSLICEETAICRYGTDTRGEVCRVATHELMRREDFETRPDAVFEQLQPFGVPTAAMHSFRALHNAIDWKIIVEGEVHGWPSFRREFPVLLYPDPQPGETS